MIPLSLTRRVVLRRVATFASAVAALAIPFACREPTAPLRTDPEVVGPAGARRAVAVLPDSMRSWTFVNDQQNTACADTTYCRLVDGPAGSPLGSGSAELATNAASDGYALVLPGFGGTRLDHVTALGYSTYRQSADAGNNLAIALQLNVDYDLADASAGWQGRIVYEPYQGAGGNVPQNTWQAWDAKAGKWWGTKATVPRNGVNVANPCVQATPCTWSELLAAFPNAGVSVAYGAVVLKAGSGWVGFRGNVDALTIEVDGVATSYDFERAAAAPGAGFRLQTSMQDGATPASWNLDTTYASGASVTYAFASRPGRAEVIVVLDDTLVPASGQFLMTRDRKLQIFSDTLYTYETLQPLERTIADMERAVLFGGDKKGAQEALTRFYMTELSNGTDPAALVRATQVAEYVASDPIADSTAMRVTDAALTGFDVFINIYPDPTTQFDVWSENAEDFGPIFPDGPVTQRTSSTSPRLSAASRRTARMSAAGLNPSAPSRNRQLTPSARTGDISNYLEFPTEQLYVIYTNGIWTNWRSAALSATLISRRLQQEERFNNWWTTVELHHNRTSSEEADADRRTNPCAVKAEAGLDVLSKEQVAALYARCRATGGSWSGKLADLDELRTMRAELMAGWMPSNPDALRMTQLIATRRNSGNGHVIAVGHSEGTVLIAQAIRALPTIEPHAVNVANRCVAAMALAPLAPPDQFGLDQDHVKGLLANGDIATDLAGGGWRTFDANLSQAYRDADLVTRPLLSTKIHYVNPNYLLGAGGELFATEMTSLHRECLPRRATLTLSSSTAEVGSSLSAHYEVFNQNDREIFGRVVGLGGNVRPASQQQESNATTRTVTAWYPSDDPGKAVVSVTDFIRGEASLRIPVYSIPLSVTSQTTRRWVFFAAANAPTGPTTFDPPPPSTPPGSCSDHVRFTDSDGAWKEFSTYCETAYTLVFDRLAELPGGLGVDDVRITMPTATGEAGTHRFDNVCTDEKLCIESAKVEFLHRAYDDQGQMKWDVVGRSAVVPIGS